MSNFNADTVFSSEFVNALRAVAVESGNDPLRGLANAEVAERLGLTSDESVNPWAAVVGLAVKKHSLLQDFEPVKGRFGGLRLKNREDLKVSAKETAKAERKAARDAERATKKAEKEAEKAAAKAAKKAAKLAAKSSPDASTENIVEPAADSDVNASDSTVVAAE